LLSLRIRLPLTSLIFPYTTLFRSIQSWVNLLVSGNPIGHLMQVQRRYEILDGLPTYGPMYVPVSEDGEPFYSEGFVVRFYKSDRSEEHTSELQSRENLVCRLLLEK